MSEARGSALTEVGRPPRWALVPVGIGSAFLAVPVAALLLRVPWRRVGAVLGSEPVGDTIRVSLVCSLTATLVALLVGLPLAWWMARASFRGLRVVRGLVILPVVLPPVFAGVALVSAFGREGLVGGWMYGALGVSLPGTTAAAVMAEAFVAMPFLVLAVEGALRSADRRLEQTAATLGAGSWTMFRTITLPSIAPAIATGALLAWARALGEFGATITFAGDVPGVTRTLPLAAYAALDADSDAAVVMGLVLIVVSLTLIVLLRDRWLERA